MNIFEDVNIRFLGNSAILGGALKVFTRGAEIHYKEISDFYCFMRYFDPSIETKNWKVYASHEWQTNYKSYFYYRLKYHFKITL